MKKIPNISWQKLDQAIIQIQNFMPVRSFRKLKRAEIDYLAQHIARADPAKPFSLKFDDAMTRLRELQESADISESYGK